MGVMKGTITYVKFYVKGELPSEKFHETVGNRIRTRKFQKLSPEDDGDVSVGWVPIETPYDEEISFRQDGMFFGAYLNLGLRIDRWRFPAALVKAKTLAAERAYKSKVGKEKLSKSERAEIRDLTIRKLRREGVPVTAITDMTWNLDTGELRFFGKGKSTLENFHELFERTFGLKLIPATPYTTGCELDSKRVEKQTGEPPEAPSELVRRLQQIEPTPFHQTWSFNGEMP